MAATLKLLPLHLHFISTIISLFHLHLYYSHGLHSCTLSPFSFVKPFKSIYFSVGHLHHFLSPTSICLLVFILISFFIFSILSNILLISNSIYTFNLHKTMPLQDTTNKPSKFWLHVDLDEEYATLRSNQHKECIPIDSLQLQGSKAIDIWTDGSLYPHDP